MGRVPNKWADETGSNAELCARFRSGSQKAFQTRYNRHRGRVLHLALKYTKVPDDAEDITQIVFLRAYGGIDGFREQSKFFTWLYRVALNCCHDWMKQVHQFNVRKDALGAWNKASNAAYPVLAWSEFVWLTRNAAPHRKSVIVSITGM